MLALLGLRQFGGSKPNLGTRRQLVTKTIDGKRLQFANWKDPPIFNG
jgi:hypothetical protein